jgi:pimeloyl-ACP methyl ester carboxylesterase
MKFLVEQQPAYVATSVAAGTSAGEVGFDPAKPTVVLIHGAAEDHSVWNAVLSQTEDKQALKTANLLAVDLPGHGQSFGQAKVSIEAYADWLINLLDNGGIKTATLIGHSMGSLIALDVARHHPKRVSALGLTGTAVPMPVSETVQQLVSADVAAACEQLARWNFYLRKNADGSFPPPTRAMQTYRTLLAAARPGVMTTDLAACAQYQLNDAAISAISVRTFILASEHDKMAAAAAAVSLCERLPNATLTMLSGVGHAMMQQAPVDVATWLTTLIESELP